MNIIRQSFKRQIFVLTLVITLAMVIISGVLTVQGFQARLESDYAREDKAQELLIRNSLLDMMTKSDEAIDKITEDETLMGAFTLSRENNQVIYAALYEKTAAIRDFASVDLYSNGNCVFSTQTGLTPVTLPKNYSVLKEAKEHHGKTVYGIDLSNSPENAGDLLMAREVLNVLDRGIVVVRIHQDNLKEVVSDGMNSKDGFALVNSHFRAFCEFGTASDGVLLSGIRNNLLRGSLYNDGIRSNIYINDLGNTGLITIYVTPKALDESAIKSGYQIIAIMAIVSVLACLLAANRVSEYFSKPITALAKAMKQFRKGDFDTRIELNRQDEFEQLATGFNKMTTQLKDTMEERVAAERKINETRIAMMQSQLNPHFLYNTLDTIKWVAKANQVPEVATLSSSLAGILRMSISTRQFCTLETELRLVERYCEIQKIRFDDFFDLIINVPEELKDAVVPKLILQPLVENAIIHGLEDRDDGRLYISAESTEGSLEQGASQLLKIYIEDNGKGISDEMIEILEADDPSRLEGHLGLNNVNTIIKLYYGKDYGITANRLEVGGTIMTMILPLSKKEPEND
ncbi:two-component system, sensor histidine kinase YesM [Pseudobutyrivibrio sp. 49]|uniref:sensor histidine kinase n=1 Tax=unclassified Pseudobutyrivibrio TaxID=2638619 RepID=UPI00088BEB4B|nr:MULTISPECIES: sensor histidine kinase [unclassified Pseudobutyrivibrio]SDI45753.1 two-component system, sensor histidine kinase YesM [Pseudobutyrivibrio sp. 49]SFO34763.1 two-component system, sensor histidine kinase YesM [Pseudobutyrivibrio sp. UC1225]